MSGDLVAFVDSNVLIYAVARDEPEKQARAREIVARGFAEGCFAISTQVMLEVYVNVTRKARIKLSHAEASDYVRALAEWTVVGMTPDVALAALALAERARISPWDAAILESARRAGCKTVLSEGLSDARSYGGVLVQNPFS